MSLQVLSKFGTPPEAVGTYTETATGLWDGPNTCRFEWSGSVWNLFTDLPDLPALIAVGSGGDDSSPLTSASFRRHPVTDDAAWLAVVALSSPGQLPASGGGGQVVTSPGSFNPQATGSPPSSPGAAQPSAPGVPAQPENFLSSAYPQSFTEQQKAQLAENLEGVIETSDQTLLKLPATNHRLQDMNNPAFNGTQPNRFTLMVNGDSMGMQGVYPHLSAAIVEQTGVVGYGLEELWYKLISGTMNSPATPPTPANPRGRTDVWGNGEVRTLENGAVVDIGRQFGPALTPVPATTASFYFGAEAGLGTVEIYFSTSGDDAAFPGSWTLLDTVNTDNGGPLAPSVNTYTLPEEEYVFKLVVTSGEIQLIGALIRNDALRGTVLVQSALGGTDLLAHWANANQAILNAVVADIAPTMILHHFSMTDLADAQQFPGYLAQWNNAAALADHVWMGEHQHNAGDTRIADYQAIYQSEISAQERWEFFNTNQYLPLALSESMGWNDDTTHHDLAWPMISAIMLRSLGIEALTGKLNWPKVDQTGNLAIWKATQDEGAQSRFFRFNGPEDKLVSLQWQWTNDDGNSRYWEFKRLASNDAVAPSGFQLFRLTSGGDEVITFDASSRGYFGSISGGITQSFGARVFAHEGSSAAAAIAGRHSNPLGDAIRFYNHNGNNPVLTGGVQANGVPRFTLTEYANDAAADADSDLPSGAFYKVTGDRAVYQKP
jgi:hypothetical protein